MRNFYKIFTCLLIVMLLPGYSSLNAQTFNNEIPVPYLMTGNNFEINISGGQHTFDPNGSVSEIDMDVSLATYCYNKTGQPANEQMSYLGPTLIFTKDEHLTFDIENNLPDGANTTIHWHGLNIPGEMDGGRIR